MNLPKRIFLTGVPGSRWSGIAQILEDQVPGFNSTDQTLERDYTHSEYSGHKGAYFGTGMEFEPNCSFTDQAWEDPDAGCMIVKSHEWAYDLKGIQIYQTYKQGDWIMLVYRPDTESYAWWHQAGGFNITYPNYEWYQDSTRMLHEIQRQNKKILEFAYDNDCKWSHFSSTWVEETFGHKVEIPDIWPDILVTMVKK